MKYEVHLTRNVTQFMQVTVDAPTKELAETFAVVEAQNAPEYAWELESSSMVVAEDISAAR